MVRKKLESNNPISTSSNHKFESENLSLFFLEHFRSLKFTFKLNPSLIRKYKIKSQIKFWCKVHHWRPQLTSSNHKLKTKNHILNRTTYYLKIGTRCNILSFKKEITTSGPKKVRFQQSLLTSSNHKFKPENFTFFPRILNTQVSI